MKAFDPEMEAGRVTNFLASMPAHGHSTVDRETLKVILLQTGGQLMARGELWNIKTKSLGAGVHSIRLEEEPMTRQPNRPLCFVGGMT